MADAKKKEPFGGKQAAPFGSKDRQEPKKTERMKRASSKQPTPKKSTRSK